MKVLSVYDAYNMWVTDIREAVNRRDGWMLSKLAIGDIIPADTYVFLRPDMNEANLTREKRWLADHVHRSDIRLVTDAVQVMFYEDKCGQAQLFETLLPSTWVFRNRDKALQWVEERQEWPIVSKAAVGASSQYVHVIDKSEAIDIVEQAFGEGIDLKHHNWDRQKGYVLFQHFLPNNDFTWRVNVIGEEVAVFKRHNYKDRPVAQTGNTDPVSKLTPEVEEVISFGRSCANMIGSKWVALDILRDHDTGVLYLLETSLGWPWPGVGEGAKFFPSGRPWNAMFDVMLDEIDRGVFE